MPHPPVSPRGTSGVGTAGRPRCADARGPRATATRSGRVMRTATTSPPPPRCPAQRTRRTRQISAAGSRDGAPGPGSRGTVPSRSISGQEVHRVRDLEGPVRESAGEVAELVTEVGDDVRTEVLLDVLPRERLVLDGRAREGVRGRVDAGGQPGLGGR